jgi:hypothetical protein
MLRITMAMSGFDSMICREASMPFRLGMAMSITTTIKQRTDHSTGARAAAGRLAKLKG